MGFDYRYRKAAKDTEPDYIGIRRIYFEEGGPTKGNVVAQDIAFPAKKKPVPAQRQEQAERENPNQRSQFYAATLRPL